MKELWVLIKGVGHDPIFIWLCGIGLSPELLYLQVWVISWRGLAKSATRPTTLLYSGYCMMLIIFLSQSCSLLHHCFVYWNLTCDCLLMLRSWLPLFLAISGHLSKLVSLATFVILLLINILSFFFLLIW